MILPIFRRLISRLYNSEHYFVARIMLILYCYSKKNRFWALSLLSRLYYNIDEYGGCLRCIEEIETHFVADEKLLFLKARSKYSLGLLEDVEKILEQLESNQISKEKIIFLKERISYRKRRYMESIDYCTELMLIGASVSELANRFELIATKGNLWLLVFETVRNNSHLTHLLWCKFNDSGKFDIDQSVLIARQFIEDGQYEYALPLVQDLLSIEPSNPTPYNLITLILLYRKRNYSAALPFLKSWIALQPNNEVAWRRRLDLGVKIDSFDEISLSLDSLVSLQPLNHHTIEFVVKRLMLHKLWSNELVTWLNCLNIPKDSPIDDISRTLKEYSTGDSAAALEIVEKSLDKFPSNEGLIRIMVNIALELSEVNSLKNNCERQLLFNPNSESALRGCLLYFLKTGATLQLKQEVNEVLNLVPSHFEAHRIGINLAFHLDDDLGTALVRCNDALIHYPWNSAFLGYHALLQSLLGSLEPTEKAIGKLMELHGKSADSYLISAQAQSNLGNNQGRIALINKWFQRCHMHPISSSDVNLSLHPKYLHCNVTYTCDDGPLISVIMTTFNWNSMIDSTIDSILSQTYKNIELIIVDDSSKDDLYLHLKSRAENDDRIKLYRMEENGGTYLAKNHGLTQAMGEFITFMDSDDWAHPQRLEFQSRTLQKNGDAVAVIHNYLRINEDGNIAVVSGRVEKLSCISLMIKSEVHSEIGFFDSLRVGADSEFIERIQAYYGENSLVKENLISNLMLSSEKTLTGGGKFAITWRGLTGPRLQNRGSWMAWHRKIREGSSSAFLEYPLLSRPYIAPVSMLASSPPPAKRKHELLQVSTTETNAMPLNNELNPLLYVV
ncbi:MAG TPA: glycosyltransferase [Candidatus Poseidoniales archaeon]|nr:glycosyltransferase [Candidatus Poseidoniales archaeon]